jgi:hypothetical protein
MPMTGAGLAAARKAAVEAVPMTQSNNATDARAYGDALRLADSTAIVTYIIANALVVGTDSHGDSHGLLIT